MINFLIDFITCFIMFLFSLGVIFMALVTLPLMVICHYFDLHPSNNMCNSILLGSNVVFSILFGISGAIGMAKMRRNSTCSICGYNWEHGMHGGHSCSKRLRKRVEILEAALTKISECPKFSYFKAKDIAKEALETKVDV